MKCEAVIRLGFVLPLIAGPIGACGAGVEEGPNQDGPSSPDSALTRRCYDAAGRLTTVCAVPLAPQVCAAPSPTADCARVDVELQSPVGDAGPCLRIVVTNDCPGVLYSTVCIEHLEYTTPAGSQCWHSTTRPGSTVDRGQCQATGRYSVLSSRSTGELDVIESQCPPPELGR